MAGSPEPTGAGIPAPRAGVKVGILALQGEVSRHAAALRMLEAEPVEVRSEAQLDDVDGFILPGGESTTMSKLLDSSGLREPLAERLTAGLPVLGTCAGMILLATDVLDGRADQRSLGIVDVTVRRNAFGRQVNSFEADLDLSWEGVAVDGGPFHAVFIRAPVVEAAGPDVEVLATVGDRPVLARQGAAIVASFHPELTDDHRLHRLFLSTFEEN